MLTAGFGPKLCISPIPHLAIPNLYRTMDEVSYSSGSIGYEAIPAFKEIEVGEPDSIKCLACNGDGKMNIAGMKLDCMKCKGKGVMSDERKRVELGTLAVDETTATVNARVSADGKLMSVLGNGLHDLVAGVHLNTGIVSGRYLVELRLSEPPIPPSGNDSTLVAPDSKHLVRFGVSTVGASPLLASDSSHCAFFDSEGFFTHDQRHVNACVPFGVDRVVGLLINLESGKGAASQTLSLFLDGHRISEAQPLPEALHGKVLVPTITFKNVLIEFNVKREPYFLLPFTCRTIQDAVVTDIQQLPGHSADAKCEVLFPIGLPDTGVFDWVDSFLARNPTYVELSDRKLLEWASKSGLTRQKGYAWRNSLDRPGMDFGITSFEDSSAQGSLMSAASELRRNIVVAELKANLIAEERQASLAKFSDPRFVKVGVVLLGEPDDAHKALVQKLILADKRQKAQDKSLRDEVDLAKRRFIMDKVRRRSMGALGSTVTAPAGAAMQSVDSIELTEEEESAWHCPSDVPDLTPENFAAYMKFSLPSKHEGFTELRYMWQPQSDCEGIMQKYLLDRRLTTRLELLKPGDWFISEWLKWSKALQNWRKLQAHWKDPTKREAMKAERKKQVEDKGDSWADIEKMDTRDLDVEALENIEDVGNGEPLCANFEYEDWVLLSWRYEMHILCHAFREDCGDPEHPGIPEPHLGFYYQKYFKKVLDIKICKAATTQEMFDIMGGADNSVRISQDHSVLENLLSKDEPLDKFVKFVELLRRERERSIEAGDEAAKLIFVRPRPATAKLQTSVSRIIPGQGPKMPGPTRPATLGARPVLKTMGVGRMASLARAVATTYVAKRVPLGQLRPRSTAVARPVIGQARPVSMQAAHAAALAARPRAASASTQPVAAAATTRAAAAPARSVLRPSTVGSLRPTPVATSARLPVRQAKPTLRPPAAASQTIRQLAPRRTVPVGATPSPASAAVRSVSSTRSQGAVAPKATRPIPQSPRAVLAATGNVGPQKRPAPSSYNTPPPQRPRISYNAPGGSSAGGCGGKGPWPTQKGGYEAWSAQWRKGSQW